MLQNDILFSENFDILPFPVVIVDDAGKIVSKNKFAYKLKMLRKNSSFCGMLVPSCREKFLESVSRGESEIFECIPEHGVSHALTVKLSSGNVAIFMMVCSVLMREMIERYNIGADMETFSTNKKIIETYKEICNRLNAPEAADTAILLRNNALRFSRAARHFSMYVHTLTKTADFEKSELCDTVSVCRQLTDYFQAKVSPLGYRIHFSPESHIFTTMLQKRTFVSVFLECMAVSLRISDNLSISINVNEFDGLNNFIFYVKSSDINSCKNAYFAEFEFVQTVCKHCGWTFSPLSKTDSENAVMSFSVPITAKVPSVHAPSIDEQLFGCSVTDIADEVFTVFYFGTRQ